ncbi:hypothetical protein [Nitrososphaera sp.]
MTCFKNPAHPCFQFQTESIDIFGVIELRIVLPSYYYCYYYCYY